MRIGAKTTLNMGVSAASDGLNSLANGGWLMRMSRQQDPYLGHPAGRARPAPGDGPGLVVVMFGALPPPGELPPTLPVRWEPLEPTCECAVLLEGDISLAPLGHARSTLTLGGTCWMLPADLSEDGHQEARTELIETARAFITSVAIVLAGPEGPGQEPPGPASSWLTGRRQIP